MSVYQRINCELTSERLIVAISVTTCISTPTVSLYSNSQSASSAVARLAEVFSIIGG